MFELVTDGEMTGLTELVAELEVEVRVKLRRVAELIGERTIAYLKAYTSGLQPPVTKGGAPRAEHVGKWADITREMVDGYGWRVTEDVDGLTLELFNRSKAAIFLEMRNGYFVLHPVMDAGGPVEQALKTAVHAIAPDWTVFTRD